MLQVFDEGRWFSSYAGSRIWFYAVFPGRLQLVQSWVQTKGGIKLHLGRAYLYGNGRGSNELDEILNLREVHEELSRR